MMSLEPPRVRIGEDRGRRALLVEGVVQSVAPDTAADGYWSLMTPPGRPRRTLLLGLGGGTLAHLLVAQFGPAPIVAVDDDADVVALCRGDFGPLPPSVQVVLADARTFVLGCRGRFDFIAVDLFHGARTPRGAFGLPFLRGVRDALTPRGRASFNLFRDGRAAQRIDRIGGVFRVEQERRLRDNVVLHVRR